MCNLKNKQKNQKTPKGMIHRNRVEWWSPGNRESSEMLFKGYKPSIIRWISSVDLIYVQPSDFS